MDWFSTIITNDVVISLSQTLLHFLWQGTLLAGALLLALKCIHPSHSHLRYMLALLTMLAFLILPGVTFWQILTEMDASQILIMSGAETVFASGIDAANINWYGLFPYVTLAWAGGVMYLSARLILDMRGVFQLTVTEVITPGQSLQLMLERLRQKLNITSKVSLKLSRAAEVPMVIGWLRPVILLPLTMTTGLSDEQLEMLLAHELAHIKRHDFLINFLQTLLEVLFFFHPGVQWVSKQVRIEREYCSDDVAIKVCKNRQAYAHALVDAESVRQHSIPQLAMAATAGDLKARVLRIVEQIECAPETKGANWLAIMTAGAASFVLLFFMVLTYSYSEDTPTDFVMSHPLKSLSETLHSPVKETEVQTENGAPRIIQVRLPGVVMPATTEVLALVQPTQSMAVQLPDVSKGQFEELAKVRVESKYTPNDADSTQDKVAQPPVEETALRSASDLTKSVDTQLLAKGIPEAEPESDSISEATPVTQVVSQSVPSSTMAVSQEIVANTPVAAKSKPPRELHSEIVQTRPVSSPVVSSAAEDEKRMNDKRIVEAELATVQPQKKNKQQVEKPALQVDDSLLASAHKHSGLQFQPQTRHEFHPQMMEVDLPQRTVMPPQTIKSVVPKYPRIARFRGLEADVKVSFVVNRHGRADKLRFKNDVSKYFKRAVKHALRDWRFEPAEVNGEATDMRITKIFSFSEPLVASNSEEPILLTGSRIAR